MQINPSLTERIDTAIDELIAEDRRFAGLKFELYKFAAKVVYITTPDDFREMHEDEVRKLQKEIETLSAIEEVNEQSAFDGTSV